MDKNKIGIKQTLPYAEAIGYLEQLLASFKAGTIVIAKGEEQLTLTPAELVSVEIEAKAKKGISKFSLELSWVENIGEALTITDKAIEPASNPAAEKTTVERTEGEATAPEPKVVAAKSAPEKKENKPGVKAKPTRAAKGTAK
ncbi:MAG: amphi-Trp domain-containing protein [Proteobacteria bacterium]|nr:amphi-Trp domain-containing protein [Pseudomonadota bacterium]